MARHFSLLAAFGFLATGAIAACGAPQAPAAPALALGTSVERTREVTTTDQCLGKRRIQAALGRKVVDAPEPRTGEKYTTDPALGALSPAEAYRHVAPSVVLIRTRDGLGSGVLVDDSGLVLTNFHVVDDFQQPDLTMQVSLELPEVLPTGRMARSNKVYEGRVVKADPVKDLALVRITDPPKGLHSVKLSGADPQIGENVLSIGHAGIGLLWAAKTCTVGNVGDQTRDTSSLEAGDCSIKDKSDSAKEATRRQEQCEAHKREIRERVEGATQGLSVQTNCSISFGDSGGPLVNTKGEIVGLNQSLRFALSTAAFHVHVGEIRAFMKDVPAVPIQILPDPWCQGGIEATAEDMDGDGKVDTVKLGHDWGDQATFIDLNEDDSVATRTDARPFAADVIIMHKNEEVLAWYDTDGDGRLDVVLRDKEADGTVDIAWRIDASGKYTQDAALQKFKTVDVALLTNPAHHARFAIVAENLGWEKFASDATIAAADTVTPPEVFTAVEMARALSPDGDKEKPVMVMAEGPLGGLMMIDVKSDALANLKSGDDARSLLEKKALKPQFVTLDRPNGRWALYDLNADGKLDLALFAKRPSERETPYGSSNFATDALDLSGAQPKKALGYVGRSLMRPKLIADEKARRYANARTVDDGRATFPKALSTPGRAPWHFASLGPSSRRVIERTDRQGAAAMVDLKGSSKGAATKSIDDIMRDQSWDSHVTFIRIGKTAWAYYDSDSDGNYDDVLFTKDLGKNRVDSAFHINRAGDVVTPLPDVKGSLFQPERVTKNPQMQNELREIWDRVSTREASPGRGDRVGEPSTPPPPPGPPPGPPGPKGPLPPPSKKL